MGSCHQIRECDDPDILLSSFEISSLEKTWGTSPYGIPRMFWVVLTYLLSTEPSSRRRKYLSAALSACPRINWGERAKDELFGILDTENGKFYTCLRTGYSPAAYQPLMSMSYSSDLPLVYFGEYSVMDFALKLEYHLLQQESNSPLLSLFPFLYAELEKFWKVKPTHSFLSRCYLHFPTYPERETR